MEITNELIHDMVRHISEKFNPYKVIVFGSWARGQASLDSDIDFLVIMDCKKSDYVNTMTAIRKELRRFPIAKDVIVANPETIRKYGDTNGYIYRTALNEGRVVYER